MNKYGKMGAFVLCLFATWVMHAQVGPRAEKIKSLKVAFITERLNLSSAEAQVFWPIYNEHERNTQMIRRKERLEIQSKIVDLGSLSDSEANDLLDQLVALEREKQELHIAFINRVSQVISPRKTILLIKAEEDFKRRLLKEIQQRRKGGQ